MTDTPEIPTDDTIPVAPKTRKPAAKTPAAQTPPADSPTTPAAAPVKTPRVPKVAAAPAAATEPAQVAPAVPAAPVPSAAAAAPVAPTVPLVASTAAPTPAERRAAAQAKTAPPAPPAEPGASFVKPKAEKSRRPVGVVAAIAVAALVGGISGAGVSLWAVSLNQQEPSGQTAAPTTITVNDPSNATNTTAVASKASASVVTISVADGSTGGSGSGVILSADGYILTNTHVVTLEGAVAHPDVQVTTNDGRLFDAKIVGTDPIADLAVIKVNAKGLVPIDFADSSKLNVGDTAIAIGAPLGLAGTVTDGIVSSLNRSISIASSAAPDESDDQTDEGDDNGQQSDPSNPFDFWQFDIPGQDSSTPTSSTSTISLAVIQTDAAINPGNSGGALLDGEGKLIGINVAIASAGSSSGQSGSIGVGFAIPSNLAKRIADEIIETGSATHGLLGANVLDVTEDEDQSDSATVGASIKELVKGGAADEAGLKVGDVITAIDGIRVTGKTDLTAQVRAHAAGSKATLSYTRDGKAGEVTVTLGELKA